MNEINYILPELFIIISIMGLLMIGVFKKNSENLVYNLTMIVFLISFILLFNHPFNLTHTLFNENYKIDYLSSFMKSITLISIFFVMLSSKAYVKAIGINKVEYPILILTSVLGMLVMISSNELITFYIGLELQSLSLYVLASFNRDEAKSSESGLKYFVLSALSSGLLLYGCSLIYGFTGTTNFDVISSNLYEFNKGAVFGIVFILVGLSFKISAVPFHMWAPDVYEGSPTSITLLFSIAPKIAALTIFIRFLYIPFINVIDQWQIIIIFISISSMIFGAVAAMGQKNIKRLLAYSSIGHIGYILAGLTTGSNEGIQSSITYLSIYIFMNLGIFSCIFMMKRENTYYENIDDLSGLSKNHPVMAICMLLLLFSLAGIPPLAGFFAKFYVFMAILKSEMYYLAIVGLTTTVISAYYYLRIIKIMYFDDATKPFDIQYNYGIKFTLFLSTILTLFYFLYPSPLFELILNISLI